jgi:hypothetical protein
MVRSKSATLNLRIDPSIKEAAEKAAADDRRSLTSLVELLLVQHLRERGFMATATAAPAKAPPPAGQPTGARRHRKQSERQIDDARGLQRWDKGE